MANTKNSKSTALHIKVDPRSVGVPVRKWPVALTFAILFGNLGLDRFYLGRTGIGLLKFFTFGLFGILWIADIIMIATKSVKGVAWEPRDPDQKWAAQYKTAVITIAIFLLFTSIGAIAASNSEGSEQAKTETTITTTNDSQPTANEAKVAPTAKIGEPVRDGKFEFIVRGIECGKPSVGTNQFLTKQAQGQFCLLSVSIKNVGDVPQSLFADNQYLFNAAGQKYSADSSATLYAAPDGFSWYSEINPGNSVEGAIVFDIPKDQVPASAELHDSAFSGGIKVNIQ